MSHVVAGKAVVTDLDCLEAVLKQFFPKLQLKRGQKTYKWFGQWVKDYHGEDAAYKNGIDPKDFGKCEHAITMEGCAYEIGLVKAPGKEGFTPIWDFWGTGRQINEYIGKGGEKLMVHYGTEFCNRFAESIGGSANTETDNEDERVIEIEVNQ